MLNLESLALSETLAQKPFEIEIHLHVMLINRERLLFNW